MPLQLQLAVVWGMAMFVVLLNLRSVSRLMRRTVAVVAALSGATLCSDGVLGTFAFVFLVLLGLGWAAS